MNARKREDRFFRTVDANFNRAKEGLRVCEDVCRFWYDDKTLTRRFKDIRQELTGVMSRLPFEKLLAARDIIGDVGKGTTALEFRRKDSSDIFFANVQRVKESLRVLEEFVKLSDRVLAERIKRLRYRVYSVEKLANGRKRRSRFEKKA